MSAPMFGNHTPPAAPSGALEYIDAPELGKTYPSPAQPMKVAAELINEIFNAGNGDRSLVWWRGTWWTYTGTHWEKADELDVRGPIYYRLEDVTYSKGEGDLVDWAPTKAKVSNILEPLAILTRTPAGMAAPGWLKGVHATDAGTLIPLRNGLLDRPTGTLHDHTPQLFATWSLEFDYDPTAECPQWEHFIAETFAHDPAAGLALQEWFGYVISGRTDLQKGCILMGPGGSGKGVIDRILKALMGGVANVAAASMQSLTNDFGLADWVGKPLAVLSDSRDSGAIPDSVVSRLLSVIGEDAVPVEAKYENGRSESLPTRVMIVSNEMPSFRDSSGALVKRWVVIETAVSHRDNPDLSLEVRLKTELPGIFLWALAGLQRLEQQRGFTTPESTAETIEMMNDTAAPEAMFIQESYTVTGDPSDFEWLSEVYPNYAVWIEKRGNRAVSQNRFKGKVKAAGMRGVTLTKRDRAGTRKEVIAGISRKFL